MIIPEQKEHRNEKFKAEWIRKTTASLEAIQASKLLDLKNKNVLEIACWIWHDSKFFAEQWAYVTATDISDYIILENKKIFKESSIDFIELDTKDIKNYNFHKTFNLIFASFALHYFDHTTTKEIIKSIYNITKPWWYLYFIVKSTNDKKYWIGEEIEKNIFLDKWHIIHLFDKEEIQSLLDNFKIIIIEEEKSEKRNADFWKVICQKI